MTEAVRLPRVERRLRWRIRALLGAVWVAVLLYAARAFAL